MRLITTIVKSIIFQPLCKYPFLFLLRKPIAIILTIHSAVKMEVKARSI